MEQIQPPDHNLRMVKSLKEGDIIGFIDSEGNKGLVTKSDEIEGKYIAHKFIGSELYANPTAFELVLDFGLLTDIWPIKIYVFDTLIERMDWLKK